MTNRASRRGFTLAELIAAVALLALFSVFIVQIFAKSDQMARKARTLDQAVACAANLADGWRADLTDDVPQPIIDLRSNPADGRSTTVSLDAYFQTCPPEQAVYAADLTLQAVAPEDAPGNATGIWQLSIVIGRADSSGSAPIYVLKTRRCIPEEVEGP